MIQNIFDSHAHYNNPRFDEDRETLLADLHRDGVRHIVNIGADLETSRMGLELARQYDFFSCTVGVHPTEMAVLPDNYIHILRSMAADPQVRAIGEAGLDYFHNPEDKENQKKSFCAQLEMADELNLPIVVHSREAHADSLEILKHYRPQGVVHCFSGSAELAEEITRLGMYLGFTGVVTFKNARRALEAAAVTPLDKLLIETDCPYMAPEPWRGERCNSGMLTSVLEVLAEIKGVTPQQLADITCENAMRFYGIS